MTPLSQQPRYLRCSSSSQQHTTAGKPGPSEHFTSSLSSSVDIVSYHYLIALHSPFTNNQTVEWTGYVFRIISSYNLTSTSIFIIQTLLLLLPPSLFAASIYMVLGRIILFTNGESMAPIHANWLTKIFVIGDVFSFLVQAGGKLYSSRPCPRLEICLSPSHISSTEADDV